MGSDSRMCVHCGRPLTGRQSKYCSRLCHNQDSHDPAQRRARYENSRERRTCEVCGKGYKVTYSEQRTCGRRCGAVLRSAHLGTPYQSFLEWRTCPLCAEDYCCRPGASRKHCGRHDSTDLASFAFHLEKIDHPYSSCPQCGKRKERHRIRCDACIKANAKASHARRGRDKGNYRKRARYYGVPYEPISRIQVFERDNWRCHICGRKTLRSARSWHPRAATLDHLIPMAKGGPHLYANVACACHLCNSVKGDRAMDDQLLLLGR